MTEPEWINGKAQLERCYFCGESRAVIKKSQQYRQNIYCAQVSSNEGGTEVDWERDRHKFVISKKAYEDDLEAEMQMYDDMAQMYDSLAISPSKEANLDKETK